MKLLIVLLVLALLRRTQCVLEIASSHTKIWPSGASFVPADPIELLANVVSPSFFDCATTCNTDPQCRTFVFDSLSDQCLLYEGEVSTGIVLFGNSSTSRMGSIQYFPELYTCYNKTSDQCRFDRYVTSEASSGAGVCPKNTYWSGAMCLNQLYFGSFCNVSDSCRADMNLICGNGTNMSCGGGRMSFAVVEDFIHSRLLVVYERNLIKNGDGETGPCQPEYNITHPTDWSYVGSITQASYSCPDCAQSLSTPGPR